MSTVPFACPQCGYGAQLPPNAAGQQLACPGCGTPVIVGAPAPARAPQQAPAPAAPPIQFNCSSCHGVARVPAQYAGQQAKCSACGAIMTVPAQRPAPRPQVPAPARPNPNVIAFHCACGNRIEVAAAHAGTRGNCNQCGGVVQVPGGPPAAAPAPPVAPTPAASSAPIVFHCPNCGALGQVPAVHAGQQGQCASCRVAFTIPHQSTAQVSAPQVAHGGAAPPARAAAGGLALAPEPGLDLAEPEPEPEPEPESEEEEPPPRRGQRGGKQRRRKPSSAAAPTGGGAPRECPFCFAKIPGGPNCPSCGMELAPPAPARGKGRSRGRGQRRRSSGPTGSVQVMEAIRGGIADFTTNAGLCLAAMVIFQIATTIVGAMAGFGAGVLSAMIGSLAGVVISGFLSIAVTMVVVTYLLQGQFALWLACARDEPVDLGLLFSQPISGGVSGFFVQVTVTIAYVGLCIGIGFFIGAVGNLVGALVGIAVFFIACCLLVLICGLSQIYIVDQSLGFGEALSAASNAVSASASKLVGYAAICVGAVIAVALLVAGLLYVLGFAPNPLQPKTGEILVSTLAQGAASLAFLCVMGTSLTRVYLQLSGR